MNLSDLWASAIKETGATTYDQALSCFAKKVAAAEREACAVELMSMHEQASGQHNHYHFAANKLRSV